MTNNCDISIDVSDHVQWLTAMFSEISSPRSVKVYSSPITVLRTPVVTPLKYQSKMCVVIYSPLITIWKLHAVNSFKWLEGLKR